MVPTSVKTVASLEIQTSAPQGGRTLRGPPGGDVSSDMSQPTETGLDDGSALGVQELTPPVI